MLLKTLARVLLLQRYSSTSAPSRGFENEAMNLQVSMYRQKNLWCNGLFSGLWEWLCRKSGNSDDYRWLLATVNVITLAGNWNHTVCWFLEEVVDEVLELTVDSTSVLVICIVQWPLLWECQTQPCVLKNVNFKIKDIINEHKPCCVLTARWPSELKSDIWDSSQSQYPTDHPSNARVRGVVHGLAIAGYTYNYNNYCIYIIASERNAPRCG